MIINKNNFVVLHNKIICICIIPKSTYEELNFG